MIVYNIGKSDVIITHGGMVYKIDKGKSIDLPDDVANMYLSMIPYLSKNKPRKIREDLPQDSSINEVIPSNGPKLKEIKEIKRGRKKKDESGE